MNSSSLKPSLISRVAAGLAYIMPVCLSLYPAFAKFDMYGVKSFPKPMLFMIILTIISILLAFVFLVKLVEEDRKYWIYHLIRSIILWPLSFIFAQPFYFALLLWAFAIFGFSIALCGERKTIFSYILPPKETTKSVESSSTNQSAQNISARDKLLAQMKRKQQ